MGSLSRASRAVPPASESFSAPRACEEPTERGNPEVGESQREPVRVLYMVAQLESQRLKRKNQREPGSLPQKSSFPGKRVLFAHGTQADESALEAPDIRVNPPAGSVPVGCGPSRADHCSRRRSRPGMGLLRAVPQCQQA